MKKNQRLLGLGLALISFAAIFAAIKVPAVVFTSNLAIGPLMTNYEGADVVISNCTVTVDGPHTFASVLVGANGVLTHSPLTSGLISNFYNITNEAQVLSGLNPATLMYTNVSGQVVVTDVTQTSNYVNGVDYVQTTTASGGLQIARTSGSTIPDGSTVLVSYTWNYVASAGLYLVVAGNVSVASNGLISASGVGYGPGSGPGHGSPSGGSIPGGSGAGHGGSGGISSSNSLGGSVYDSLYQPVLPGSGGGASYAGVGGSGGGIIQIFSGGTVDIEGAVSANGTDATNSRAGGGAGGSIFISAANLTGLGNITANGGAGEAGHGGGGGGGMISIQCAANTFSGNLIAYGGGGYKVGGAGTVLTQITGLNGLLRVDNGGRAGQTTTGLNLPTMVDLVITGNGRVVEGSSFVVSNLTVTTNGILQALPQSRLSLAVVNLTVQPGGVVLADAFGYVAGNGTGAGQNYISGSTFICGGGGYGGYGTAGSVTNAAGGAPYDSQSSPILFGSGGGTFSSAIGGAGGGAMQLTVYGNLQLDGTISANGGNGLTPGGGAGSGGNINITCQTLAGAGAITANGGSAATFGGINGGGGGGGRIVLASLTNNYTGIITAYGGSGGTNWAGAGTIYLPNPTAAAQLTLDNNGHIGAGTLLQSAGGANLTVQNGARGLATTTVSFNNLLVTSNAWLTALTHSILGTYSIAGNATFQAGGGFLADSGGNPGGIGSGVGQAGAQFPYGCGGGGYGGRGGNAITNSALGGLYPGDTAYAPSSTYAGAGGGSETPFSPGGLGGGFVQMTVLGTLRVDGVISANGGPGGGLGGGGGAGGGVFLTVGTFSGGGAISANGGAGANIYGGGGGGGRIAVLFNTKNYTGNLTAYGGAGTNWGGAGTIYLKTNTVSHGQLIVDNGGNVGADTPFQSSSTADLTMRNGSSMYIATSTSFGNLVIASNAWVFATNTSPSISAGNVTVQAGGFLVADGFGSGPGLGSGGGHILPQAPFYSGSGGGHGGYGANGYTNSVVGGAAYDSPSSPSTLGSGGGTEAPFSFGGAGGGIIRMTLTGVLQVDGTLSANGGPGTGIGGGGGSGGAINVSCTGLIGAGTIAANGGNGAANIGGGGGGGMIYLSFNTNIFSGNIACVGGGGVNIGGAGTMYFRTNTTGNYVVIVDNAGRRGTNTPVPSVNSLTLRNGAVGMEASSGEAFGNLLITSNAWLTTGTSAVGGGAGQLTLTVTGNALIQAGGGMVADALGNSQSGIGRSTQVSPYGCSGGGHGGYGAGAYTNAVGGGLPYDATAAPVSTGSAGGGIQPYSTGGAGGGYINLRVTGTLQLDGSITANGANGSGLGGGGGSGGGIVLNLATFNGAGSVTANGGTGANIYGGGGGGGRIAVSSTTQNFTGSITAYGGGGANIGGAGTVYTKTNLQGTAQLVVDNANNAGTNTTFDTSSMNVIVQRGGVAFWPAVTTWSAPNIIIHSNGVLMVPPGTTAKIVVATGITIDAGGIFSLDGMGSTAQAGTGAGSTFNSQSGGAGHGGYGGNDSPGGGKVYDSIQIPAIAGSGGAPFGTGGAGGGYVNLNVTGTLLVNGRLSANGSDGGYNSGGGSGGSLYLNFVNILAGNGIIAANGGAGNGAAGGGGGGRIALVCNSNNFTGTLSAYGGGGNSPGGAGTIYTRVKTTNTLIVNNGGIIGTNTPLDVAYGVPTSLFDLNISGGAKVVPTSPLPLLADLNIDSSSTLTAPVAQTNLVLAVLNNATVAGNLTVDNLGWAQGTGPGAGTNSASKGSGGGYGGSGGASSSGAAGGITNGSFMQPVDFGSGGGQGQAQPVGGSEGGGDIRLSVGGILNVSGNLSANGDFGWQDDSGGGSGGSLLITANTLTGGGNISVNGGSGAQAGGGGGGGGRIAIYAPSMLFTGTTNANGGGGFTPGQPGTIYYSSAPLGFQISSQSPSGLVSNVVSSVDLTFNEAVASGSVSGATFTLTTPAGVLPANNLGVSLNGPSTVHLTFPAQNLLGSYTVQAATTITNIFGQPLAQNYTGSFSITLPMISGTVTTTNGVPVAGVLLQPSGLIGATTDVNGNYAIGVPTGWSGTITPSFGTSAFIPGTLSYTNLPGAVSGQNFVMISTIAPSLTTSVGGGNLTLGWTGLTGVTYQAWVSTDLVNWSLYGSAIPGTNGLQQIVVPLDNSPAVFFRLTASD